MTPFPEKDLEDLKKQIQNLEWRIPSYSKDVNSSDLLDILKEHQEVLRVLLELLSEVTSDNELRKRMVVILQDELDKRERDRDIY